MITKEEYLKALKIVLEYQKHIKCEFEEVQKTEILTLEMMLEDVDIISVRLRNCLRNYDELYESHHQHYRDLKVEDLSKISISKFKYHRNVGPNTINNLLEVCAKAGIKLKP
jgi:alpha-D-ribose 1-methylphosphonate 5-triphosphate diphosphatase PhnM